MCVQQLHKTVSPSEIDVTSESDIKVWIMKLDNLPIAYFISDMIDHEFQNFTNITINLSIHHSFGLELSALELF